MSNYWTDESDTEYCVSCHTELLWQDGEYLCNDCDTNAWLYAKEQGETEEEWRNFYHKVWLEEGTKGQNYDRLNTKFT